MIITTKIKARKVTGSSKENIRSKLRAYGASYGKHYSNASVDDIVNGKYVIAINFEKHRPKKVQGKRKFNGEKGKVRKTKIEERGHWVAYYYRFPIKMLESMNLKVEQKSRNFTIKHIEK